MKKKLLFLVNVDWFLISHWIDFLKYAQKNEFDIHIATQITTKEKQLKEHNFHIHPITLHRSNTSISSLLKSMLEIRKIIKELKPDIIELVTIKPVLLGGVISRIHKKSPVVFYISGLGFIFSEKPANYKQKVVNFIYKIALNNKKSAIITENIDDYNFIKAINKNSNAKIIPGAGIDLNKFNYQSLPNTITTIVMASRLLSDKGVNEFIEAADILYNKGLNVQFQLAGNIDPDNPASITQATVEDWHVKSKVNILGHRSDIAHLFSQAHIVVLPSYREGFPKVLIEAAACGRAVVTTDVPGCRDAIIPNVTGLLVPPRNAQALADAIEQLLLDPERCAQMGKAGRKLAEERYSIEQVVQTHLAIYQELLNQP